MSELSVSEIKKLGEQAAKRNMAQLETLMENIIRIFKVNMENASKKNIRTLELKFNVESKESFDPDYVKNYEQTTVIKNFVKECNRNDIKLKMKLKGKEALIIKASW